MKTKPKPKTCKQATALIRRWRLAMYHMTDPDGQIVQISLANRHSGVRGGKLKNVRFINMSFSDAAELFASGVLRKHALYGVK